MKRQLETKEYEVKDWAINCINLADYFVEMNNFAQAEYSLFCGLDVLPSDPKNDDEKELRASVQMQLGQYYLHRLKVGVEMMAQGLAIGTDGPLYDDMHTKFILFPTLNVKFPEIKDIKDLADAKTFFRLANTQFKKSLSTYLLDGYVTENCQLKKLQATLYKHLIMIDPSKARVLSMYQRRVDLLEPLVSEVNPNSFENIWTEMAIDLNAVFHSMFDISYDRIKKEKTMPETA